MVIEVKKGEDAVVPEVEQASSVPTVAQDTGPGRSQLAAAPEGPAETGRATLTQEALLDLADFEEESQEGPDPALPPLPTGGATDLPGDLFPGPPSFGDGQPTLETGAGGRPKSGGIGEYREPETDGGLSGLRGFAPTPGDGDGFGVPNVVSSAFGPSWVPASGLAPVFQAPIVYNMIIGTPAGDRLYGTGESDHIIGLPGNDRLYGGDQADWLQGGGGSDRIYGDAGADRIEGDGGNDRIYGGAGADKLLGGEGNDRLYVDADDTLIDGGLGTDTVYVQTDVGVTLNLATSRVENAYGRGGDDDFDASGLTVATRLDGKGGDDILSGGSGNDRLYGRADDDTLSGGAGSDRLYGGSGVDSLLGGEGNDRLYIDASDTLIDGGLGRDSVYVQTNVGVTLDLAATSIENAYGRGGDDTFDASGLTTATRLDGKGGDDILLGGSGNDRLYGRGDDDILNGGAGNDRLYGDSGADSLSGGEGNDRLYIDASDTLIDGGLGRDSVYVQTNVGVTLDLAATSVEYAYGKGGDDTFDASGLTTATRLDGKGGDDILLGGSGNDRLYGRGDDDILNGGGGNDFLYGHAGTDILTGGEGNDRLSGGDGADSFLFALSFNADASQVTGPGADRIIDFSTADGDQLVFVDVIDSDSDGPDLDDLFALEADGRLDVSESGSRVVFNFNGGGSIMLDDMATGSIDSLQDVIDSGATIVV